ncbi:MAG TPA: rRNA maturation RNase YbeY [Tepidisphaeraceae bacterium]|jgi:rRNA maturation RNase YbeY
MSTGRRSRPAVAARKGPPVLIEIAARTGHEHVSYIKRHVASAIDLLKSPLRELSVALVGDQHMSELHQRFLNIAGTTDVLTFEIDHSPREKVVAGEIIICVAEARRQAKARKHALRHELLLYAVHGLLHLHGYDDRTEKDHRRMHRKEDALLMLLGVGPVFAPRLDGSMKLLRNRTKTS